MFTAEYSREMSAMEKAQSETKMSLAPGRVAAEAINTRRAIKPNSNINMNENGKAKSKQTEELINVDENIERTELSENTTQNTESGTTGFSDFTNEEIKENSRVNSGNSNIEFDGVQRKASKAYISRWS